MKQRQSTNGGYRRIQDDEVGVSAFGQGYKLSLIGNDHYLVACMAQRRNKWFVTIIIRGDEQDEALMRLVGENGGDALQQVYRLDRFIEIIGGSQQMPLPIIIDNRQHDYRDVGGGSIAFEPFEDGQATVIW